MPNRGGAQKTEVPKERECLYAELTDYFCPTGSRSPEPERNELMVKYEHNDAFLAAMAGVPFVHQVWGLRREFSRESRTDGEKERLSENMHNLQEIVGDIPWTPTPSPFMRYGMPIVCGVLGTLTAYHKLDINDLFFRASLAFSLALPLVTVWSAIYAEATPESVWRKIKKRAGHVDSWCEAHRSTVGDYSTKTPN